MATIILTKDGVTLQTIPLLKERTHIGRRAHNDVIIDAPDISGEHAVIATVFGDRYFEDLGSTNGSKINGQCVKRHFLQNGDVVELGRHAISYQTDDKPAPTQTSIELNNPAELVAAENSVETNPASPTSTTLILDTEPAAVQILNGHKAGEKITLTQALTTIGRPDNHVAALTKTRDGYTLSHIQGTCIPMINGKPIDAASYALSNGDLIEVTGIKILFIN